MSNGIDIVRDFDTWSAVARSDPDAFEAMRRAVVEDFIDSAPADKQERLRRLQWRIDQERQRARTPMGACLRIYGMMWDSVLRPGGLRERLTELGDLLQHGQVRRGSNAKSAEVLDFPTIVYKEA